MRILPNTFAVFWRSPGHAQQFHADIVAIDAQWAAWAFAAMFPADIICSIRAANGRFAAFK